jgi:hypothetical protein
MVAIKNPKRDKILIYFDFDFDKFDFFFFAAFFVDDLRDGP